MTQYLTVEEIDALMLGLDKDMPVKGMPFDKPLNKYCIASDHAGFKTKSSLIKWCPGIFDDFGPTDESSVDYPVYAKMICQAIQSGFYESGVLICGTGQGMTITANRHSRIRATLCWNDTIAKLARQHNDSNLLVLPGRFLNDGEALSAFETWAKTSFDGGRHQKRLDIIN